MALPPDAPVAAAEPEAGPSDGPADRAAGVAMLAGCAGPLMPEPARRPRPRPSRMRWPRKLALTLAL
eukprot:6571806-Lingulodinium_polyedra.AAC.1